MLELSVEVVGTTVVDEESVVVDVVVVVVVVVEVLEVLVLGLLVEVDDEV